MNIREVQITPNTLGKEPDRKMYLKVEGGPNSYKKQLKIMESFPNATLIPNKLLNRWPNSDVRTIGTSKEGDCFFEAQIVGPSPKPKIHVSYMFRYLKWKYSLKRTRRLCKGIPPKTASLHYKVQEASSFWYLIFCDFTIFYTIQVGWATSATWYCDAFFGKYLALTRGRENPYTAIKAPRTRHKKSLKGILPLKMDGWNTS